MKLPKISTFIGLVIGLSIAQAAPTSFVYEGILQDSVGVPINVASTLTLAIYDPNISCLLYEESQSVLPSADGSFSVLVGSATGSAKRTGSDPSLTMDKIFSAGTVRGSGGGSCPSGYIANISDTRKLVISVNGTPLSPAIDLTSAPFAINAEQSEKVGTYDPSKLLRSDGAAAVAALNDTKVSLLMSLLDGTLAAPVSGGDIANKTYVDSQVGAKLNTSASFGGDISGTYTAISVDKIKGSPVAATAPANNDVLKWNGSAWTPSPVSISITSGDVTTALGYTPVNGQVTTTGEANKILSLDASAHAVTYGVKLKGTTSGGVFLGAGPTGSAYNLIFPSVSPSSGQSLQADGAGNLSWVYPTAGVTSVSVQPPLADTGTASAPVIGLASGTDPFLKWNGSAWGYAKLNMTDLKSSVTFGQQFPTTCTSSETLAWSSPTDKFDCVQIKLNNMASVTTANITVYVRNDGNDTSCNGGTDNSAAGAPNCAFATIQGALKNIPDIVRHNVNIMVSTNLINTSLQMAVVDKIVSAIDENGPMLTISGNGGTQIISNTNGTGSGFLIMSQARGIVIKDLNLNNFDTGTAIDNDGGIVFIEGINLSNNRYGVKVSRSGMVMFTGTNMINISTSATDRATAISVSGQSRVSTDTNLFISSANYQNTRGIEVFEGEFAIENGKTVTINDPSSSGTQNITGMEVSKSGSIQVCNACSLIFNMSSTNTTSTALSVRGGDLSSSGNMQLNNIAGNGLVCDLRASCQLYGALSTTGPGTGRPIQVKNHSSLNVYNDLTINSQISAGGAGVDISEGSSFAFSPMQTTRQITFSSWAAGATAIRLNQSSSFSINSGLTSSFNFSGIPTIFSASNGSYIDFNQSSLSGGPHSGDIMLDETSNFKPGNFASMFSSSKRLCGIGMITVGSGPGSFCMENVSNTSAIYSMAINVCAGKNMKLCSANQYAIYCASGNTLFPSHWSEDVADVYCNPNFTKTSSTMNSNYSYRCCR